MARWPERRASGWLNDLLGSRWAAIFWRYCFDETIAGKIDTWAFRWIFALWNQGTLAALPARNLVTNIGFDAEATHFSSRDMDLSFASHPLCFPLNSPEKMIRDVEADHFTERRIYRIGLKTIAIIFFRRAKQLWRR
jgi:hypothetical protein